MSSFAIEDLIRSASGDGGSIPFPLKSSSVDPEEIYQAWDIERGHSIECELLLKLSRKMMARLVQNNNRQTATDVGLMRALILQIDARLRNPQADPT